MHVSNHNVDHEDSYVKAANVFTCRINLYAHILQFELQIELLKFQNVISKGDCITAFTDLDGYLNHYNNKV